MTDFRDWDLNEAQAELKKPLDDAVTPDGLTSNKAFVEDGDHWQDGETWFGAGKDDLATWKTSTKAKVERQFTPVDLITECLDRVRDALIKNEPQIDLAPRDEADGEESDLSEEMKREREDILRALARWIDAKRVWLHAGDAIKRSRWATRGVLRFWVPPGKLNDGALPTSLDLTEALDVLEVMSPLPEESGVVVDEVTQEPVAVFVFTNDQNETEAELWWSGPPEAAENQSGAVDSTTVRRLGKDAVDPIEIQRTGGRLPIVEMEGALLVTEAVRRQQNRLNHFESLLNRSAETAGFPERYTINAKERGEWRKAPPSTAPPLDIKTDADGNTWYLHAEPLTLGAGVTTDLKGIPSGGDDDRITTPNVIWRDPTDPDYVIKAAQHAKNTLLRQCKQGHLSNTSRAETSGLAYEQARADHENDLEYSGAATEALLREFIESAIAWAGAMSSEAASIRDKWRVVVTININAGPIPATQREQIVSEWRDGLRSRESALGALGFDDVAAEIDRLRDEERAGLELRMKQSEVITRLMVAIPGLDPQAAAEFAGLDPEDEDDKALIQLLQRAA